MCRFLFFLLTPLISFYGSGQDLILTGVIDGPITGGVPKAIEFYATANISDLSQYAFGVANDGGGTDGPEFVLSGTATMGDFIYVATESTEFNNFFGFSPDFISGFASVNGDDAIELFYDAGGTFGGAEIVIDVFGDINLDGTGQPWAYLDGWAYRRNGTGPDGSTFTLSHWKYSGINALDGETTNSESVSPFSTAGYLTSPDVVAITEFIVDPVGTDSNYEWIELYNYGDNSVDLTGWTLTDEDTDNATIGVASISAGGYLILAASKTDFESRWLGGIPDSRVLEISFTLTNTADEIILSDDGGNLVWSLAYGDDASTGFATFLGYNEDSNPNVYGSQASPGIDRSATDVSGTDGYQANSATLDSQAVTLGGDTGSPLAGAYDQPLPVELLSLSVREENGNSVINWQTAIEVNNLGFVMEKSMDGLTFHQVGFVEGHGNSNFLRSYSFIDEQFYQSSYYRLKQIDFDGTSITGKVLFLLKAEKRPFIVFPNPSTASIQIDSPVENFSMKIFDLTGQRISDQVTTITEAIQIIERLNTGTYLINIENQHFFSKQVIVRY
ncbi:MAG: lamin tail domain-containing protein [Cyclobacteriaceae bacterium]